MSRKNIEDCIRESLEQYFRDLNGTEPNAVHAMILEAVEKPLLEVVMQRADGNQSNSRIGALRWPHSPALPETIPGQ